MSYKEVTPLIREQNNVVWTSHAIINPQTFIIKTLASLAIWMMFSLLDNHDPELKITENMESCPDMLVTCLSVLQFKK